jgi:hypothetical protein
MNVSGNWKLPRNKDVVKNENDGLVSNLGQNFGPTVEKFD